jgi:two-component system, chemotaxis family, protein-glutamate methylesterase/glutaminase
MKTLVIEDSPLYQKVMHKVLGSFKTIAHIDIAGTGADGLHMIRTGSYDVLFLDLHLPDMNGQQILEKARVIAPNMQVIIVSSAGGVGTDLTVKCLQMGALEFIVKPAGRSLQESAKTLQQMIALVLKTLHYRTAALRSQLQNPVEPKAKPVAVSKPHPGHDFKLTTIAISTGGPQSLAKVIPQLPPDYPHPILVVQHMPPAFTASLAASLDRKSSIRVVEAANAMKAEKGCVYLAPGGRHMIAKRRGDDFILMLTDDAPVCNVRPSADVLFESVAKHCSDIAVLAVVMTGMGEDGMHGIKRLKQGTCHCLTQSEDTCVVYGMPRSVCEASLSDEVIPLDKMAERMQSLTMMAPVS